MAQILAFLKIIQDGVLPHHKEESISTTNLLFRMHTKYASTALIVTSSLLFIQQLFIDHLKCIRPSDEGTKLESHPLNQFCYTAGTYATRNESSSFFGNFGSDDGTRNIFSVTHFHQYFQWVPFILLLQGMTFHLPQLVWNKFLEKGKLASFCSSACPVIENTLPNNSQDDTTTPTMKESTRTIPQVTYVPNPNTAPFASTLNSDSNKIYFYGFVLCEILNVVLVCLSIITTQWFIGGRFLLLGPRWVVYLHRLRSGPTPTYEDVDGLRNYLEDVESGNPLEGAFPTLFTCHWDKPMTDVKYVIPCILAQNVTFQRIYLILWLSFWMLILMGLSNLIYRFRVNYNQKMRVKLVKRHMVKRGVLSPGDLNYILAHLTVQDWFILKRILQNVNAEKFEVILQQVKEEIQFLSGVQNRQPSPNEMVGIELQPINLPHHSLQNSEHK